MKFITLRALAVAGAMVTSLALAGCGAGSTLDTAWQAVTATITNPISTNNLYQAKTVYAAAQTAVLEYKGRCFGSDGRKTMVQYKLDGYAELCAHRVSRWRAMQSADRTAYNTIRVADSFITNNPSGNAASYVAAAYKAATDFMALASAK